MTTYGVTQTGFVKKTLPILLGEIRESERENINERLNLLDTSVTGQLNGVFGDKCRELWDVAEAVYRSQYPDSASDEALDSVGSITGATREESDESTVTLDQLFVDGGTTITADSVVSVGPSGNRFKITEDVTNSESYPQTLSGPAESEETGPIVGNAQTIDTIQTPISGWNAKAAITCGASEPYNLDGLVLNFRIDNALFLGPINFSGGDPWSAQDVADLIDASPTGAEGTDAGGKARMASPTDGTGSSVEITGGTANAVLQFPTNKIKGFNSTDADPGRNLETDPEFRIRRDQLLRATGKGTVEAIRAAMLEVDDVLQAYVFNNPTDNVVDGMPPHSVEVVLSGGDDVEIAEALFDVVGAGIATHGTESETVTDSQGFDHTIKFSRPVEEPIYMELTILTDPDLFPIDGEDQVKTALATEGDALDIGEDVIALQFKATPLEVAGVIDVTSFLIDTVTPPVGSVNITIAARNLATFDTADIDLTVTP